MTNLKYGFMIGVVQKGGETIMLRYVILTLVWTAITFALLMVGAAACLATVAAGGYSLYAVATGVASWTNVLATGIALLTAFAALKAAEVTSSLSRFLERIPLQEQ